MEEYDDPERYNDPLESDCRFCLVCGEVMELEDKTEHRICDECKMECCQHTSKNCLCDEDYELERTLCTECFEERKRLGKLY